MQLNLTQPRCILPSFSEKFASIPNFLFPDTFAILRDSAEKVRAKRVNMFVHKKGSTVSYSDLIQEAPKIINFYHSPEMRFFCSAVVGEKLYPTPLNDQISCALLVYDQPGDHITWHYDHNFYNGRHFTVLLPIINRHLFEPRVSSAELQIERNGQIMTIPTPPNTFIMFEGSLVRHKVTRLGKNEQRVLISMTYCTNSTTTLTKSVFRRLKDTGFFGLRALWA